MRAGAREFRTGGGGWLGLVQRLPNLGRRLAKATYGAWPGWAGMPLRHGIHGREKMRVAEQRRCRCRVPSGGTKCPGRERGIAASPPRASGHGDGSVQKAPLSTLYMHTSVSRNGDGRRSTDSDPPSAVPRRCFVHGSARSRTHGFVSGRQRAFVHLRHSLQCL